MTTQKTPISAQRISENQKACQLNKENVKRIDKIPSASVCCPYPKN